MQQLTQAELDQVSGGATVALSNFGSGPTEFLSGTINFSPSGLINFLFATVDQVVGKLTGLGGAAGGLGGLTSLLGGLGLGR